MARYIQLRPGRKTYMLSIAVPRRLVGQWFYEYVDEVTGEKKVTAPRVVERSLKTRDLDTARLRAAEAVAELRRSWANVAKMTLEQEEFHLFRRRAKSGGPRVSELREEYLKSRVKIAGKTRDMARTSIKNFSAQFDDPAPADIDRQIAAKFIDAMKARGLKPATINRETGFLSKFWQWAQRRNHIDQEKRNPFDRQHEEVGDSPRRPFTVDELNRLLQPSPIRWHILGALFSGLRCNELCTAEIRDSCFIISKGKTKAARRIVPIHATLLAMEFDTEFQLNAPELRGAVLSQRFTRWRRDCGIGSRESDDDSIGFHSLRHNFATAADNAGFPESVLKRLFGHKIPGLALSLYSKGPEVAILREWINRIQYPGLKP